MLKLCKYEYCYIGKLTYVFEYAVGEYQDLLFSADKLHRSSSQI